ncbi:uncharacterized protein ACO6RY_04178 [Pungitius sinensis]
MLLRVKAFAALSKQLRTDLPSDERLGGRGRGGGGGGGGRATTIRKNPLYFGSIASVLGGTRPVDCQRKPGPGFEASPGCAESLMMKGGRGGPRWSEPILAQDKF